MDSKKHISQDKEKKSSVSNPKTSFKRYVKWIVIFVLLVAVLVAEFGLWNGKHIGTLNRAISLKISTTSWHRYTDRSKVEKDIASNLQEMSNFLESGQIDSAMEFVHPDQKDSYYSQFTTYPDRIPAFVEGLRSAKLVFISEELNAYESERLARVELLIPEEISSTDENSKKYPCTLTCILFEERWVIDS
ncbi:MAG: hypothetical protein KAH01_05830 [Caldisericia bacterium]|nr:hypothetical protein [Caldisericia bacterium]